MQPTSITSQQATMLHVAYSSFRWICDRIIPHVNNITVNVNDLRPQPIDFTDLPAIILKIKYDYFVANLINEELQKVADAFIANNITGIG